MAEICSFCKREVTNGVCCDYCGTPVIFSDSDFLKKEEDTKIYGRENDIQSSLNTLDKTDENEQNFNEEENAFDDIKIKIYNKEKESLQNFDGGTTRVIKASDVKEALNEEEKIPDEDQVEFLEREEYENIEFNKETKNNKIEDDKNTYNGQKDVTFDNADRENAKNSGFSIFNIKNLAKEKEFDKGDMKLSKKLQKTLGIMFLIGLVSLFFPALSPTELTNSLSFSVIDVVLLIATFVGMSLAFFEKNGIRKFIYGIIFSGAFLIINIIIVRPFPPKNIKEVIVPLYLLVMLVISLIGHSSDRHTAYEKMQIWFDSFNYVLFFINLFVIALSVMIWFVMPSDMIHGIKPYLALIVLICAVAILAVFLMFKRKIAGANLFMFTAISTIILSMVAYHNIMNTIGYYNSVINLMNVIGSYYSKFIALLVAFPIIMFLSLSALNKKSDGVRR